MQMNIRNDNTKVDTHSLATELHEFRLKPAKL